MSHPEDPQVGREQPRAVTPDGTSDRPRPSDRPTDGPFDDALDGKGGMNDGWAVTSTLLSGIVVFGLIGWGLSSWTDWRGFLPIGVLLGAGLGVYLVILKAGGLPAVSQEDMAKARAARRVAHLRGRPRPTGGPTQAPRTRPPADPGRPLD